MLRRCQDSNEFLTGLIYINEEKPDFLTLLNMTDAPLATLPQETVQPSADDLQEDHGGVDVADFANLKSASAGHTGVWNRRLSSSQQRHKTEPGCTKPYVPFGSVLCLFCGQMT